MSLADVFHLTAIISFSLAILLLASLVVLVFFIMRKVGQLADNVNKKVDAVGRLVEDPGDVAVEVGASLVSTFLRKLKKSFE